MNDQKTPALVTLYAQTPEGRKAAARFRWDPAVGVSLEIVDPKWGQLARRYFERGAPYDAEMRPVTPAEGETFMRALLQPSRMTYYQFVDESTE
jgi:hypothetical protein